MDNNTTHPGETRGGTHFVIPPSGGFMSIFHDGGMDPRVPGMEVVESFKVTEVDWDMETGEWVSRLKDGKEICRAPSKKEVVEKEHEILATMEWEGIAFPKGPSPKTKNE